MSPLLLSFGKAIYDRQTARLLGAPSCSLASRVAQNLNRLLGEWDGWVMLTVSLSEVLGYLG